MLNMPFDKSVHNPELRKQLVSAKEQADVVESLLGAVFESHLAEDDGDYLDSVLHALGMAKVIYDKHVHLPPSSGEDRNSPITNICATLRALNLEHQISKVLEIRGAGPEGEQMVKRAAEITSTLGLKAPIGQSCSS